MRTANDASVGHMASTRRPPHAEGHRVRARTSLPCRAAAALLACLVDQSAFAQAPATLEYSADAGCPDRAAFLERVRARTDRLRLAEGDGPTAVYRVRVGGGPGLAGGSLEVADASGAASVRAVEGATCTDVVEALALSLALTIDPNASGPLPRTLPAPGAPSGAAAYATATPKSRWAVHGAASLGVDVEEGVTPRWMVGPAATVEASGERPTPPAGLQPIVRVQVGAVRASSTTSIPGVGSAQFTWTVGRLALCPVHLTLGRVEAAPCARFDAGVLDAVGAGVTLPKALLDLGWQPGGGSPAVDAPATHICS